MTFSFLKTEVSKSSRVGVKAEGAEETIRAPALTAARGVLAVRARRETEEREANPMVLGEAMR